MDTVDRAVEIDVSVATDRLREASDARLTARRQRARRKARRRLIRLAMLALVACAAGSALLYHARTGAIVPARPTFAKVVESGTPGRGTAGMQLLVEPRDGDRPLVRALNHAQHVIEVECYILTDRLLIRALERARAQGVRVRVMIEPHPFGMGSQPQRVSDELIAAGIEFRWSSPSFALTHAKVMVVDNHLAVISTANFSKAGFKSDRDFVVLDTSKKDVRAVGSIMAADWQRVTASISNRNIVLSPNNARPVLSALVRKARHSIELYAEEVNDRSFETLLAGAVHRGVRVRVVLAQGQTPAAAVFLLHRGVSLRQLGQPYIHAKMLVVDDTEAFLGSENPSTQSLDRNREIGVLLRGADVGQLAGVFQRDWIKAGAHS